MGAVGTDVAAAQCIRIEESGIFRTLEKTKSSRKLSRSSFALAAGSRKFEENIINMLEINVIA